MRKVKGRQEQEAAQNSLAKQRDWTQASSLAK